MVSGKFMTSSMVKQRAKGVPQKKIREQLQRTEPKTDQKCEKRKKTWTKKEIRALTGHMTLFLFFQSIWREQFRCHLFSFAQSVAAKQRQNAHKPHILNIHSCVK
jgi:hypothetical protein